MALRPHLQATVIAAWQTHGPHEDAAGWQLQLHTYHWQQHLKNGITQASILAPLRFNIYTWLAYHHLQKEHDNDMAIMHADGDWQAVEGVLSKGMVT